MNKYHWLGLILAISGIIWFFISGRRIVLWLSLSMAMLSFGHAGIVETENKK